LLEEFSGIWHLEGEASQLWAIRPDGQMLFNGEKTAMTLIEELDATTGQSSLFCPTARRDGVEIDMLQSEAHNRHGKSAQIVWTCNGQEVAFWYRSATAPEQNESTQSDKFCESLLDDFFGLWYPVEEGGQQCWAIKHTGQAFLNGRTMNWSFQEETDMTGQLRLFVPHRRQQGVEIDMERSDPRSQLVWTKDGEEVDVWQRRRSEARGALGGMLAAASQSGVSSVFERPEGRHPEPRNKIWRTCRTLFPDVDENDVDVEMEAENVHRSWCSTDVFSASVPAPGRFAETSATGQPSPADLTTVQPSVEKLPRRSLRSVQSVRFAVEEAHHDGPEQPGEQIKKPMARGLTQMLPYPSPSCATLFSATEEEP
jgi:hypothetical protein